MKASFHFKARLRDAEFCISGNDGIPIAVDDWATNVPDTLLPGVDILKRLEAGSAAVASGDSMLVENSAIAGLTVGEATAIGLPASVPAVAHIITSGLIAKPDFGATLEWRRPTGQPILGAQRTGVLLRVAGDWYRLPDPLFSIAEAVDALNSAGLDQTARYIALAALREILPTAEDTGVAHSHGLLGSMKIAVADAFSLDLEGEGEAARLVPILHRAGGEADALLLPSSEQSAFGRKHFNAFGTAKPVYALGGGSYVVLSAPVRRALDVVRQSQSKPFSVKCAFMASPRAMLRAALGSDFEDALIESVFRETPAYSERVLGLGLWQKRVLPWVQMAGLDWLNDGEAHSGQDRKKIDTGGILIGDTRVSLSPEDADALRTQVESAIGCGKPDVSIVVKGEKFSVPASHETLGALQKLEAARTRAAIRGAVTAEQSENKAVPEVLVIRPNEEDVDLEGVFAPRFAPENPLPACLGTDLKTHQEEGFAWLRDSWRSGRPGVLLADDMGLGKTLQGLAFLAWLREGMEAGSIARAPVAVVAPTGLLENWKAEELRHLSRPGLGQCLEAFGKELATLKLPSSGDRPELDVSAMSRADWVLTTYETLRDYDRDFGAVRFAAMVFDEAQKIKTPSIRITDAAKAMNADFRIALTGTPVENRLSDLWCITDALHPAFLGDLKSFSSEFERNPDMERLRRLKASLDKPHGRIPAFLLRRLKSECLLDILAPQEIVKKEVMPPMQRAAYEATLREARSERGEPGQVLSAIQKLRAISLHPDPGMVCTDQEFIDNSARCRLAFTTLDRIAAAGEKALIFVDDLAFQARLSGLIQRRYGLKAPPAIVNGSVSGRTRQARVDRFQDGTRGGFDVMILSPRAGGVGLTLTAANHAIHLSRWWNPAVEDQCTGRILRIGQIRPVFVHLPLATRGDTESSFDLNLDALIRRKRQLFQDAFMPPEPTSDERAELFKTTLES